MGRLRDRPAHHSQSHTQDYHGATLLEVQVRLPASTEAGRRTRTFTWLWASVVLKPLDLTADVAVEGLVGGVKV